MAMVFLHVIEVWEYSAPMILGGLNVDIVAAHFGVPGQQIDVTQMLQADLRNHGYVCLLASPFKFGDPAPLQWKRLHVVFMGKNDKSSSCGSAALAFVERLWRNTFVKVLCNGVVLGVVGSAAAPVALASAPSSLPVVISVVAAGVAGYTAWYSSQGLPVPVWPSSLPALIITPTPIECCGPTMPHELGAAVAEFLPQVNECAICLEPLLWSDRLTVMDCGHWFHSSCIQSWDDECIEKWVCPSGCPYCRNVPQQLVDLDHLPDVADMTQADAMGLHVLHLLTRMWTSFAAISATGHKAHMLSLGVEAAGLNDPLLEAGKQFVEMGNDVLDLLHIPSVVVDFVDFARVLLWA